MPNVRDVSTTREELTAKYRNWDVDTETDESDDATEPFKDIIQRDPCVCDHCFTLRYNEIAHEWWRGDFGWMEYNNWIPIPGRSEAVPGDEPSKGTRLACSECGHRRGKHRPISREKLHAYAHNISETLTEKGIDHNKRVLLETVRELDVSENQGKPDSDIYQPAVRRAVRSVYAERPAATARSD
jgi:hypothetical protein